MAIAIIIILPLYGKDNKQFRFEINEAYINKLRDLKLMYAKLPDYDSSIDYKQNMIKITLSDIDIENNGETSEIDSLAAILCNKIKNKNQRTALNLLNMLRIGILDKHNKLSHDYIISIWDALTSGNRNIESRLIGKSGYRFGQVYVKRKTKIPGYNKVIYKAPPAKDVYLLMDYLIKFVNNYTIVKDNFINAIIKSIIFSIVFVYIHPFGDGNGRTSRLLMNKILIDRRLTKFKYISINMEISKRKRMYGALIKDIEESDDLDLTNYVNFMIDNLYNLFDRLLNKDARAIDISELSDREKIMLKIIKVEQLGIYAKMYKQRWNIIAPELNKEKISMADANKDLEHMHKLGLIKVDENYILYPGFRYYNK